MTILSKLSTVTVIIIQIIISGCRLHAAITARIFRQSVQRSTWIFVVTGLAETLACELGQDLTTLSGAVILVYLYL